MIDPIRYITALPDRLWSDPGQSLRKAVLSVWAVLVIICLTTVSATAQESIQETGELPEEPVLMLGKATICENVRNRVPTTEAVAFSYRLGRVYCFTDFFSVSDRTVIYHNWYRKDIRYAGVKLSVRPPRWATYSSIKIGADHKGPWRVDITDSSGKVLRVLRFSIID